MRFIFSCGAFSIITLSIYFFARGIFEKNNSHAGAVYVCSIIVYLRILRALRGLPHRQATSWAPAGGLVGQPAAVVGTCTHRQGAA